MNPELKAILASTLTPKRKAKSIADALSSGALPPSALATAIPALDDTEAATAVESLEGATRTKPELVDAKLFTFLVGLLANPTPRVRWEAARTIGNVAALHPKLHASAVEALLLNTADDGTVVRWSTAQALGAIARSGYSGHELASRMRAIVADEEDGGVRKVYEKALKAFG